MAIGSKKKGTLFASKATEPVMPPSPLEAIIREADNGFVVICHGGEAGSEYGAKPKVATSLNGALRLVKEHLANKAGEADDGDE